jgi:hypothetical protein
MIVNKREPGFAYTVGADEDFEKLFEREGVQDIKELIGGPRQREGMIQTVLILSAWHEKKRALETDGYIEEPLMREELLMLSMGEFTALFGEAMEAMNRDMRRTVQTADGTAKKNEGGALSP